MKPNSNSNASDCRIAFVVNHAAFFVSHRLALATGARALGYHVALFTGQAGSDVMEKPAEKRLAEERMQHTRLLFSSSGINPFFELYGLCQLIFNLYKFRPNIIHCASPKGVIYGGIAARIIKSPGLVLAISGMGYIFTESSSSSIKKRILKRVYLLLLYFVFRHPNVNIIVQNRDDYDDIVSKGIVENSNLTIINGSGVDLSLFEPVDVEVKHNIVLLPARMLKDKGVEEFVNAVRIIRSDAKGWRFVLAGAAGYDNPTAISNQTVESWVREGLVEWVGHIEDMAPLFTDAAIVCLPSYREGMPKVLLEAAAAGCAVVTTDVIGCREAIEPGTTGDLVPPRDHNALAAVLKSLILDQDRRKKYGLNGEKRAKEHFSIIAVVHNTMIIYDLLLRSERHR